MCKPDAVERRLVGEIISRIERKGLQITSLNQRVPDRALAEGLARRFRTQLGAGFYRTVVTDGGWALRASPRSEVHRSMLTTSSSRRTR